MLILWIMFHTGYLERQSVIRLKNHNEMVHGTIDVFLQDFWIHHSTIANTNTHGNKNKGASYECWVEQKQ